MISPVIINQLKVYPFASREEFVNHISFQKKILIALNAEKILKKDDNRLKEIINNNIGYTDGIGAVLAVKSKGKKTIKIAGVELWIHLVQQFYKTKSFYIVGSTQEIIEVTVNKLKGEYPDICLKGFRNGFINTESEEEHLAEEIKKHQPDIIFVAMGSPKQEYLMEELHNVHPAIYMGLGGSFDIYSGVKKRAPKVFVTMGLEWLYRLLKEPTRYKRQLVLVRFLGLLILRKL